MADGLRGYQCEFVEKPPHLKVECHLCSLILRDPHLTECCGRNVCLSCAEDAKKNDKSCPLCGKMLQTTLERRLRNEILECKVRCPSKNRGCGWVDKLQELDSHEKICEFAEVDCPLGCGLRMQRRSCEDHMLRICMRSPLPCPNQCGKTCERRFQDTHLRHKCPLEGVECVFCKTKVKRKDLKAHYESEFQTHLKTVSEKSNEMQANWQQMKQEILSQHEEKVQKRESEISSLETKLSQVDERVKTLQKLLFAAQREVQQLQEDQKRNKAEFVAESAAREWEIQALKDGITELQVQARAKCFGPPPPRQDNIVSRPIPSTVHIYMPPVTFAVDNFEYRKQHQERWYSPPFYTHSGGYKMCLEVYPDGFGTGRYKWVSVFIAMVKGENDHHLKWPFSGSFTVEILNQKKNSLHKVFKIVFNHAQVESGFVASDSFGCQQFIPHTLLYPSTLLSPEYQYLKNNCLHIKVSKAQVFN